VRGADVEVGVVFEEEGPFGGVNFGCVGEAGSCVRGKCWGLWHFHLLPCVSSWMVWQSSFFVYSIAFALGFELIIERVC